MDVGSVIFYLFAIVSTLYVVHFGVYLTGANIYDMWQLRRKRHTPLRKYRPLVSVLVPAHNEGMVIVRCLDSIWNSTYQNIQVVVCNDASTDATRALVRAYQRQHPDRDIVMVRKQTNVGKGMVLNHGLKLRAKGELVMTLDADSMLMPQAIENAVAYFEDTSVAGVAANVRIIHEPTVLGVLQRLEHMISYRSKKVYSLLNCEFVIGGVASTYRMDLLRKVGFYDAGTMTEDIGLSMKIVNRGNRRHRLMYGADVAALTEGVETFGALLKQRYRWKYGSLQNLSKYRHLVHSTKRHYTTSLTWYRLPMAVWGEIALLASPILWGYVIYLTLSAHDPRLIVGAYLTITVYTLITLWFDEHISFFERVRLSLYAPLAYVIFYVMDFVQFISIARCVPRLRQLLRGHDVGSTWVSPQRIGRKVEVAEAK